MLARPGRRALLVMFQCARGSRGPQGRRAERRGKLRLLRLGRRAPVGAAGHRGCQRLVHDLPDGTRAPAALRAATEAAVDLAGGAGSGGGYGRAHVAVTEDVTGADDHRRARPGRRLVVSETIDTGVRA